RIEVTVASASSVSSVDGSPPAVTDAAAAAASAAAAAAGEALMRPSPDATEAGDGVRASGGITAPRRLADSVPGKPKDGSASSSGAGDDPKTSAPRSTPRSLSP